MTPATCSPLDTTLVRLIDRLTELQVIRGWYLEPLIRVLEWYRG